VARESDDAEIRRLLRDNPLEGAIRVSLEGEPNGFLTAAIQGDIHQILVGRDEASGRLLGMGSRAVMQAYMNGRASGLGYLSQLRLDRGHRGMGSLLKAGYAKLRALHEDGAAPFYVTTIIEDNRSARRLLEAGLAGLPTYRLLEPYVTLVLPVARGRARRPPGLSVDRAGPGDLEEIVACLQRNASRYQFAPHWTREDLVSEQRTRDLRPEDFYLARRGDRVVGCLALWDQRGFKQAVVRGYHGTLRLMRPMINLVAPWLKSPRLPPPGTRLHNAFLSHVAVDDDEHIVLLALVDAAREGARARHLDYLTVGFARRSPLLDALGRVGRHREYVSLIYVVHWEDGVEAVGRLDGRIPQLEAAIL
jgi:hypothetical protein